MKSRLLSIAAAVFSILLAVPLLSAEPVSSVPTAENPIRLGIFIPGALGDSPPFDALADAARRFALRDNRVKLVNVFEAGFDQSKWSEKFIAMAASGKYDVIYSSNESTGGMAIEAAKQVPNVKFIVNDCYVKGNDRIASTFMNKYQQSYLYGYMMALISSSQMKGANQQKKIGFVYGQHYITLDELIIPGMIAGAKAVDPAFEVKTVMLGNWYDAKKAESLANSLIDAGVDCIGCSAGSGNAGVIRAAANRGIYMCYYDTPAFDKAPSTIVGCVVSENGDVVMRNLDALAVGKIKWGTPEVLGAEQGFITVPLKAPSWVGLVSEDVRKKFQDEYDKVVSGEKPLPLPQATLDKINAASWAGGN
jgi:simple sugar transport system substrate-binding protein